MKTQVLSNKTLTFFLIAFFFLFFISSTIKLSAQQPTSAPTDTAPLACPDQNGQRKVCSAELEQIYQQQGKGETCTGDYELFKSDPAKYHFWIEDQDVTVQGKSNDRARQFIYWVTTHTAINNHPVLTKIWGPKIERST